MNNITIEIKAPELVEVLRMLAQSLHSGSMVCGVSPGVTSGVGVTASLPDATVSATSQEMTAPAAPTTPAPAIPTTTQAYEMEQLAVAATQLVDANRTNELLSLLSSFRVEALTHLPKEQYGAFATALRGLGVRI